MAPDPLTVASLVLEATGLLKLGWSALMDRRPEYGVFWKELSTVLEGETNVVAEDFDRARLDPDFVGIAVGLMRGAPGARIELEAYFEQYVELTNDSYEDRATVIERLMWKAEFIAGRAIRDDRDFSVTQRRLIEETVERKADDVLRNTDERTEELKAHLDSRSVPVSPEQLQDGEGKQPEAHAVEEGAERLRREGTAEAAEVERIIERANERFAETVKEQLDERIDRLQVVPIEPPEAAAPPSPAPPSIVPVSRPETASVHVDELRTEDEEAGQRIQALLDAGGPAAVIATLQPGGELPETVGELVAAARIASDAGHFREAETGFLAAKDKADDPSDKARQLVRAFGMASVQGDGDRAERHLSAAEQLAPRHPSVVAQRARKESDPRRSLEMLERVEPETERDRTQLHVVRSEAHLRLGNYDAARAEIEDAEKTDLNDLALREMKPAIVWAEAQDALAHRREPNLEELHAAAIELVHIAGEVGQQQRFDESALVLARAVEAFALSGDLEAAEEHLESIQFAERLSEEACGRLANAAITARRPDLVDRFASAEATSEDVRLKWAEAQMFGDRSTDEREQARLILAAALHAVETEVQKMAAFSLLVGASNHLDVDWDQDAAKLVEAERPDVVASLRAERLEMEGEAAGAERLLLPHAGDLNALRQLRDLAARAGNSEVARDRAREVVRRGHDDRDRLAYGRAVYRDGDALAATLEFLTVARSESADPKYRRAAYGAVIEMAGEDRDLTAVLQTASEWNEVFPDDADALWNRLFALARLARHRTAYELYLSEEANADSRQRALLLAEILHRGAPRSVALETLAELSDKYERKEEGLEAMFIATALAAEQEGVELPEELYDRIRDAVATFTERFPDSDFMQVVEVPTTAEGIRELLEEMAGDSIQLQKEAMERITAGHLPVNGWAAASPTRSVLHAWARLWFLPLGFATDEADAVDREAAEAAIGGAAVWDPSSIFVAGGLGDALENQIRGALPGSMIPNEVLDDISQAEAMAPEAGTGETVHDPETGAFVGIRDRSEEEVKREKRISDGSMQLAQELDPRPSRIGEADEKLKEFSEIAGEGPWAPLFASVALAQTSGRSLYSDDRWIRSLSRFFGVPAFGTVALIDALAEHGVISAEQRLEARHRLMGSGGWGLKAGGDEFVTAGETYGWTLGKVLAGALRDQAAWRAGPALYWLSILEFLDAVHSAADDRFRVWVLRAVDAAQASLPELPPAVAPALAIAMGFAIDQKAFQMSPEGFQRLVDVLRTLPSYLETAGRDPLFHAIDRTLSVFAEQSDEFRYQVLLMLLSRLNSLDAVAAHDTFVRIVPASEPRDEGSTKTS